MPVVSQELALRYLLELSTDIRVALLHDPGGELLAAAPEQPAEKSLEASRALVREAQTASGADGSSAVEIDIRLERGTVFLAREEGPALVCVTGPLALPGLILHDMRIVLADLRRGGAVESGS
jgi:hypothetical protein